MSPLLALVATLQPAALAGSAPVQQAEVIRGGYGFELGAKVAPAELERQGFRGVPDLPGTWERKKPDGTLRLNLTGGEGEAANRITSIIWSLPEVPFTDAAQAQRRCIERQLTPALARIKAEHPGLRQWTESSATRQEERLGLLRPLARSIDLRCSSYNASADAAGGTTSFSIVYRDGRLSAEDYRRREREQRQAQNRAADPEPEPELTFDQLRSEQRQALARAEQAGGFGRVLFLVVAEERCDRAARQDQSLRLECSRIRLAAAEAMVEEGGGNQAREYGRKALTELRELGASTTDRARALMVLGSLAYNEGLFAEAETHARQAVEMLLEEDATRRYAVGKAHRLLAATLLANGRLEEADVHAKRATAILDAGNMQNVDQSWSLVASATVRADVAAASGRDDEALDWYRRAIGIANSALLFGLAPDAKVLRNLYTSYGRLLLARGDAAGAERVLRVALRLSFGTVSLGTGNDETNDAHYQIGRALVAQRRLDEAELYFRQSTGGFQAPTFAAFAEQRSALAELWRRRNAYPRESYALYDQANMAVIERALTGRPSGPAPQRALAQNQAGLLGQVETAWAAAHLPPEPPEAKSTTDAASPVVLRIRLAFAESECRNWTPFDGESKDDGCFGYAVKSAQSLRLNGRLEEAERWAKLASEVSQVMEVKPDGSFEDNRYTTTYILGVKEPRFAAAAEMAAVLEARGRLAEAEALLRHAVEERRRARGPVYGPFVEDLGALARNLAAQRRWPDAERAFRERLAAGLRLHGEVHPVTAASYEGLAQAVREQGRAAEAEAMAARAAAIRQQLPAAAPAPAAAPTPAGSPAR